MSTYQPLGDGAKNVASSGSPVPLVSIGTPANRVDIQAKLTNTGVIAVGGKSVSASSPTGIQLQAGDVYNIEKISDLFTIFIDSTVNGEGVTFTYWIGDNV